MVVGPLWATRVMRRLPFGTVVGLVPVTGFVAAAVMALTTLIPSALLAGLSFFLLGVGPILWVISTTTLRQSVTPPRLLGRVSAINIMSYGARPVGAALGAIDGDLYGADLCLFLAVAIFGAHPLVILLSPTVGLVTQPDIDGDGVKTVRPSRHAHGQHSGVRHAGCAWHPGHHQRVAVAAADGRVAACLHCGSDGVDHHIPPGVRDRTTGGRADPGSVWSAHPVAGRVCRLHRR